MCLLNEIMKYYSQLQLALYGHRVFKRLLCAKVPIPPNVQEYQKCTGENNQFVPLLKNALFYADNVCIKDFAGQYTYKQLYVNSKKLSLQISNICGSGSSSTIAFFSSNDALTVLILWSIWLSGQTAMALKSDQPLPVLSDLVKRNKTRLIISSNKYEECSCDLAFENSISLLHIDHKFLDVNQGNEDLKRGILMTSQKIFLKEILYKDFYNNSGAFFVHNNRNDVEIIRNREELNTQIRKAAKSWNMSKNDRILYACPSINSYIDEYIYNILFPLSAGSQVYTFEPFDAKSAWRTILGINIPLKERINVLIAEPKVYQQLIQEYDKMFAEDTQMVDYIKDYSLRNIRLMMTCFLRSDPTQFSTWFRITGHTLLESDFFNTKYTHDKKNDVSYHQDTPKIRVRIVHANNKVLLELDGAKMTRFWTSPRLVVGRLMISKFPETFYGTGEIVCYNNGVIKKIGRYQCSSN